MKNFAGMLPLIAAAAHLSGCGSNPAPSSEALPIHELSMRFTHPELYEGRDDFARPNALHEMLSRKVLCRGMSADEIHGLLGWPEEFHQEGVEEPQFFDRIDEPSFWVYERLDGGFEIEFEREEKVTKFTWYHEEGGPPTRTW